MEASYAKSLERNLVLCAWWKMLTKRIYLPLITIWLVARGGVTVEQLAVIAAAASLTSLVLQMPTGYLADKLGNRFAMVLGASIAALSPLILIFMPDFIGGLLANIVFFGGYAFVSGATESLMHDTLVAMGREGEYSRVMGRAQSYGLIGNVVFLTLVPATYLINPYLPFVLGFFSQLGAVWIALKFTYPKTHRSISRMSPLEAVRSLVTAENVALFLFAGAMIGVAHRGSEYRELLFQDLGIPIVVFGVIIAMSSLVGAVMGLYVHVLDRLKPLSFYAFDVVFMSMCLILAGAFSQPAPAVAGIVLLMAYMRVRMIIFQSKLLVNLSHVYKATLISGLNFFGVFGEIAAIAWLSKLIGLTDFSRGHFLFGLSVLAIGFALWLVMVVELSHRNNKGG